MCHVKFRFGTQINLEGETFQGFCENSEMKQSILHPARRLSPRDFTVQDDSTENISSISFPPFLVGLIGWWKWLAASSGKDSRPDSD